MKKIVIFVFGVMLMVAYGCNSDDAKTVEEIGQPAVEATEDAAGATVEDAQKAGEVPEKADH